MSTGGHPRGVFLLRGPDPGRRCATVDRVHELAPVLRHKRAAAERDRAITAGVLEAVAEIGALRMGVPAAFGGADLAAPDVVAVVEALAYADASIGWVAGQIALGQAVLAYLDAEVLAGIYTDGPDVRVAGAAAPKGRARRDGRDWVVSGRWPLVSGVRHASWVYLQCAVTDDGTLPEGGERVRAWRTVVCGVEEVRVLQTWRGLGLAASGSHDVQVRELRCPPARVCDLTGSPAVATAMGRVPARTQAGLVTAGFLTGVAAAALEAIVALARHKRPSFSATHLSTSPRVQDAVGEATASLDAARALLFGALEAADAAPPRPDGEASLRAVAAQTAELATSVVDVAYALGGSSSVTDASPLQRCLRDARSIAQHATVSPDLYGPLGATLGE